jgi:hypothetical protein
LCQTPRIVRSLAVLRDCWVTADEVCDVLCVRGGNDVAALEAAPEKVAVPDRGAIGIAHARIVQRLPTLDFVCELQLDQKFS